jgi:hypothetical protein
VKYLKRQRVILASRLGRDKRSESKPLRVDQVGDLSRFVEAVVKVNLALYEVIE